MQEAHDSLDAKLDTLTECIENLCKAQKNRCDPGLHQLEDAGWPHNGILVLLRQPDQERQATGACHYIRSMVRYHGEIAVGRIDMEGLISLMGYGYVGDYSQFATTIPLMDVLYNPHDENIITYASEATFRDDRDLIMPRKYGGNQPPIGAERKIPVSASGMASVIIGCPTAHFAGQRSGPQTMSRRYGPILESVALDSAYVAETIQNQGRDDRACCVPFFCDSP